MSKGIFENCEDNELCKICMANPSSIDHRLNQFPSITTKEPCPTCDDCKELWLKKLSEFLIGKDNGSGIYTYEDGIVKEISEEEWMNMYPDTFPLRYARS